MSNHSPTARGTDLPFSHKSVISIAHEQNIICSKTLICRQLFAGHVVGSRPMKRKDKIHLMINTLACNNFDTVHVVLINFQYLINR